jgi:predicted dehydrogenase
MNDCSPQACRRLPTRRDFLRNAGAAAILIGAGGLGVAAETPLRLKAAVIGHTGRGDYGHGLEGIFQNRPGIELVALADPDPAGRAKAVAKVGAPRGYGDYREMLAKERPQLVSLAMRQADQHHAIALDVLRAGAHLYCEKPFVTSPVEADELLAEAKRRGRRIAVAHTMRMMPAVVRLKQALAGGLIGDVVEVRAHGKQDTRAGGEDMMVLGSHLFDLMRLFLGNPLSCSAQVLWKGRDITAADGRRVTDDVGLVAGDEVFARFAFGNGANVAFTSTARLRETAGPWGLEFLGSKGVARINCDIAPNVFVRRAAPWKPGGRTDQWEPLDPALVKSAPGHNLGPVGDWLEAIAQDREPECSGRNGAWAVEMVMAVYHAALSGRRVTFPLADRGHPLTPAKP